ncbi:MAG: OmpH family outer membrane protein [Balneolaceae bacterium]
MSKKFAIILLFLSVFSFQEAFSQVKIGYTNPAKVLSQLSEVDEINQQVEELITERDKELGERAAELQQIFSSYESGMAALSEQERSTKEEELMQLNQQFEEDREGILNEVRQKRNELMRPIIERMNTAMEEVAKEMGLDMVLNEGTSNGDAIIFFASSENLEITNKILAKLQ